MAIVGGTPLTALLPLPSASFASSLAPPPLPSPAHDAPPLHARRGPGDVSDQISSDSESDDGGARGGSYRDRLNLRHDASLFSRQHQQAPPGIAPSLDATGGGSSMSSSSSSRDSSPSSVAAPAGSAEGGGAPFSSTIAAQGTNWKQFTDERSGAPYWFNEATDESSWTKPGAAAPPPPEGGDMAEQQQAPPQPAAR